MLLQVVVCDPEVNLSSAVHQLIRFCYATIVYSVTNMIRAVAVDSVHVANLRVPAMDSLAS